MNRDKEIEQRVHEIEDRLEVVGKTCDEVCNFKCLTPYVIECKMWFEQNSFDKLPSISESIDEEIITVVNKSTPDKDIIEFNNEELFGTRIRKLIAINIISEIRSHSSRETELGARIYLNFREMINTMRKSRLEIENNILFEDAVCKNTFLYILSACQLDTIKHTCDLSNEFFLIMGASVSSIPQSVDILPLPTQGKDINIDISNELESDVENSNEKLKKLIEGNIAKVNSLNKLNK